MKIDLFLTSVPFGKDKSEGKTVVVIDVLRASTTICAALSSGARAVIPANGQGEAGEIWTKIGSTNSVIAGETAGRKIDNFQLGNSPLEFTRDVVADKFVIMSTTNGTPVFKKAGKNDTVICCALVNMTKVLQKIIDENQDVCIVCAGKENQFSLEDTLCAGLLIDKLKNSTTNGIELNDAARLALLLYNANRDSISKSIKEGEHALYLKSIGFESDLDYATDIDSIPIVPILVEGQLVEDK